MQNNAAEAVCLTHVGGRTGQEDNFVFDGESLADLPHGKPGSILTAPLRTGITLYAVSDGMGGHNAGEVASGICTQRLIALEQRLRRGVSWEGAVERLRTEFDEINKAVVRAGREHAEWRGMGATLLLLVTDGTRTAILHAGDSRAFLFDGTTLHILTKDHTEGQRMLDLGLLSESELSSFPARKHLNRYIGLDRLGLALQPDVCFPQKTHGCFLLCTDGLTDTLSKEAIALVLKEEKDWNAAGQRLVRQVVRRAHADNVTLILIPVRR